MALAERTDAERRVRPYDKLLVSTIAALIAVALAGLFLWKTLPGSPALRCVGFVVFGTTAFIATTVWWQVALAAIGHTRSNPISAHVARSLGAILAVVFALSAAEYALYAWTQSRAVEGLAGVTASLIAFTMIGAVETRYLAPPEPAHVERLRTVGRMFVLVTLFIVIDAIVVIDRPHSDRFRTFRECVLALEFTTAPALLVGAWFVRRRYRSG